MPRSALATASPYLKLMCNERAGRIYGEDGYGDEYLVLLTADTVREMAFSAWCEIRNAEITAAREKAVGA